MSTETDQEMEKELKHHNLTTKLGTSDYQIGSAHGFRAGWAARGETERPTQNQPDQFRERIAALTAGFSALVNFNGTEDARQAILKAIADLVGGAK